jgi:hypothetical protein
MSWNDLTNRQKLLDRAIEASGIKLDNSSSCLKKVMKTIGANSDEEDFVKERIALRLRTQQLLNDTDNLIEKTERMLDDFDKDDARWKALGKKLGFDL